MFVFHNELGDGKDLNAMVESDPQARKIIVRFDNDRGYPDNITVDWVRGGIDEEYELEVVRVTPR